jgi:hypothetical protein
MSVFKAEKEEKEAARHDAPARASTHQDQPAASAAVVTSAVAVSGRAFGEPAAPKEERAVPSGSLAVKPVADDQRKGHEIAERLCALLNAYDKERPADIEEFGKLLRRFGEDGSLHQKENLSLGTPAGQQSVMRSLHSALVLWSAPIQDSDLRQMRDQRLAAAFGVSGCFAARVTEIADAQYKFGQIMEMLNSESGTPVGKHDVAQALRCLDLLDAHILRLREELDRLTAKEATSSKALSALSAGPSSSGMEGNSPELKGARGKSAGDKADLERFKAGLKDTMRARVMAAQALQWFCEAATIEKPTPATRKALAVVRGSILLLAPVRLKLALTASRDIEGLCAIWAIFDSVAETETPQEYKKAQNTIRKSPPGVDEADDAIMKFLYG